MKRMTAIVSALLAAALVHAAPDDGGAPGGDLDAYFGFEPPRFVVIDDDFGPAIAADLDGDGLQDLVVANNAKSRIEAHLQRDEPLSIEAAERRATGTNEMPPNRWYERVDIPVQHRVTALRVLDLDGDGANEIVYAGQPSEIVVLRESEGEGAGGRWEIESRRRVRGLAATRTAFEIADLSGDRSPEVATIVDGRAHVFPFESGMRLGSGRALGAATRDQGLIALFVEDYDGNGAPDLLGVAPEADAPLRVWLQQRDARSLGSLGAELRFASPALREVEPVRTPDRRAASIAVIERATRRIVLYDLARGASAFDGEQTEAQIEVRGYPGGARERSVVVADVDGDGDEDVLATDAEGNRLALWRAGARGGLSTAETHATFKAPDGVAVGPWGNGDSPSVFVLSSEERVVGVSAVDGETGEVALPEPIRLETGGATPESLAPITLDGRDGLAIALSAGRRDVAIELHSPEGHVRTIELEDLRRAPESMLAFDVDQDGGQDLLLLSPGEPMTVVLAGDRGVPETVLTDEDMAQYGLVSEAGPGNTGALDVDGDGRQELLIADANFVRACVYDRDGGWRIVSQVNDEDPRTAFSALAVDRGAGNGARVIVADDDAERIDALRVEGGEWTTEASWRVAGFPLSRLFTGSFDGARVIASSDEGFAVVRTDGPVRTLEEVASYRSDEEDRLEHEISVGDVNGDGYTDLVVLDAQRQMCQVLTLSASRRLLPATAFSVFESRMFGGGEARQFEPRDAVVADVTGDGAQDLTLVVHDRLVVYPQMTEPE